MNWLISLFNGATRKDDNLIRSATLNSTKITAILTAFFAVLATAWDTIAGDDGPLAGLTEDQQFVVWVGAASIITALVISDTAARAYVTGKAAAASPVLPIQPRLVAVRGADGRQRTGTAMAARLERGTLQLLVMFKAIGNEDPKEEWHPMDRVSTLLDSILTQ